jgi:hypothetical protein
MTTDALTTKRLAALVSLVSEVPEQTLGRTAAVKLVYFLQELKGVPLGYDFRLHTYGTFDAEVLADLSTGKSLQVLTEKVVTYSAGYGYEIKAGPKAESITTQAKDWLQQNSDAISSVARDFGIWSAADLELGSTVVFVDRDFKSKGKASSYEGIAACVRNIKPHFSEATVLDRVKQFHARGWLASIPAGQNPVTSS